MAEETEWREKGWETGWRRRREEVIRDNVGWGREEEVREEMPEKAEGRGEEEKERSKELPGR